ncbi:MAG TPA: ABC transporter ATP-binding protein [Sandaracinaceae bacterium LLY-WYZ-13_1]|nr:ABC transporter ATP-binding protein [Sandaracinaceae bacterium LLY-WYZ-13_1]
MTEPLLRVEDLVTAFHTDEGVLRAVDGVSFELADGQTLGIVGESGCGKSVTSLSVMGLVPQPPGVIERGRIVFEGTDLLALSEREMRRLRGNRISMIFQEPMTSLNPVHRVGRQISEAVRLHRGVSRTEARERAIEMLDLVGIPAPSDRVDAYPHELSGGMRQRVMIAMALACEPRLLMADEPTTALDVTIQAQILELLGQLKDEMGMSIVFITHDLGVVAELCDEVVVMYAGTVVERARTADLYREPLHPYTEGLLRSVPGFGEVEATGPRDRRRLPTIAGVVPDLRHLPTGCRFQDRCPLVEARCREAEPPLETVDGRRVACFVRADERRAA